VTIQLDQHRLTVRGSKDYKVEIDEIVGVSIDPEKSYLFDTGTQQRLWF